MGGKHSQVQPLRYRKVAGILCIQGLLKKLLEPHPAYLSGLSTSQKHDGGHGLNLFRFGHIRRHYSTTAGKSSQTVVVGEEVSGTGVLLL